MKAEVINLPWHTRRWKQFEGLSEQGLVERADAVIGKELDLQELQREGVVSMATARRIGRKILSGHEILLGHANEVGCMLSHANRWRALLADPDRDCALVMEDDVAATEQIVRTEAPALKAWLDAHRPGWDFVMMSPFGLIEPMWDRSVPPEKVWDGVYIGKLWKWYGTGAYLVSRKGARAALGALFPVEMQVDGGLCTLGNLGRLAVYGVFRSRPDPTDGEPRGSREPFVPLSLECVDSSLCHAPMTMEVGAAVICIVIVALIVGIIVLSCVLAKPPRGASQHKTAQPAW